MKGAKYKILHDFQASKNHALGKDYSFDYAKNNGLMLYFYNEAKSDDIISLSFKAFLESFSIEFSQQYKDPGESGIENIKEPQDFSIKYKFKLNIPSISLNDARVNAARLEELNFMYRPIYRTDQEISAINNPESNRILLANLIHNGKYKEMHDINTPSLIKSYGLRAMPDGLSYNAIVEDGYYEYKGKLFYKTYSLDFSLDVDLLRDPQINDKRYFMGYSTDKAPQDDDIISWPFGVL